MEKIIKLKTHEEAVGLYGDLDQNIKFIQKKLNINIIARNQTIKIEGNAQQVHQAENLFQTLLEKVRKKQKLTIREIQNNMDHLCPNNNTQTENYPQISIQHFQPYTKGQKNYLLAIQNHDLTFATGPAGTGKTYLAVVMAVNALKQGLVQRIVLVRPAVEAGEKLGFLPGDFQQKINPYLRPLYDALNDILGMDTVKKYLENDVIEVIPLAYMRGRTLNRSFIILDEAQNTTTSQMKMFLTRMGQGSKIVITGDNTQIDIPEQKKSGLLTAQTILKNIPGIAFVKLTQKDIVRHPLIQKIIQAYENHKA